jgi:hypothetical protein
VVNDVNAPLLCLVELHGDWQELRRLVFVNPAAIASFTEEFLWRAQGTPRPRVTRMRLLNGDCIRVIEQPEQIATWLTGVPSRDIEPIGSLVPMPKLEVVS